MNVIEWNEGIVSRYGEKGHIRAPKEWLGKKVIVRLVK
jgi:putative transposon-encoded protein